MRVRHLGQRHRAIGKGEHAHRQQHQSVTVIQGAGGIFPDLPGKTGNISGDQPVGLGTDHMDSGGNDPRQRHGEDLFQCCQILPDFPGKSQHQVFPFQQPEHEKKFDHPRHQHGEGKDLHFPPAGIEQRTQKEQRPDDDEILQDRRQRRQKIHPFHVQTGCHDAHTADEDGVGHQDRCQQCRDPPDGVREIVRQQEQRQRDENRQDSQQQRQIDEQRAELLPGPFFAFLFQGLGKDRHQRLTERAFPQDLPEHVCPAGRLDPGGHQCAAAQKRTQKNIAQKSKNTAAEHGDRKIPRTGQK